jgi:hypothetical protein
MAGNWAEVIVKAARNLHRTLRGWWGPAVWSAADLYELEQLGIAFSGPVQRPKRMKPQE